MAEKANILLVDDRDENLVALEAILSSLDQNMIREGRRGVGLSSRAAVCVTA